MKAWSWIIVATVALLLPGWPADGADRIVLNGPEVAKLDWNTRSLVAGDLDGDGLVDLALINNDRARIDILYQRAPGEPQEAGKRKVRHDRWEPVLEDSRFVRGKVISGSHLYALALGDLNSDGRMDLVYTGNDDPLTIRYQDEDSLWKEEWTYDEFEPQQWIWTLVVADVDLDERDDLLVLGTKEILVFLQSPEGRIAEPRVIKIGDEVGVGLKVTDLNSDGLPDLLYVAANDQRAVRVRFQNSEGLFGAEIAIPFETATPNLPVWRGAESGDTIFASIQRRSHFIEFFSIVEKGPELTKMLQPRIYTIGNDDGSPALYAMGDFDGDGRGDLAVAESKAARILLYLQLPDGNFANAVSYPSFSSISGIAAGSFDESGRDSIVVVSKSEGIAGVTQLSRTGRLDFPTLLQVQGEPTCAAVRDLDDDGGDEVVLVEEVDGSYVLTAYSRREGVLAFTGNLAELRDTRRDPTAIKFMDLNRDDRDEVMVIVPREAAQILVEEAEGEFAEAAVNLAVRRGLLSDLEISALTTGDLDGDGLDELVVTSVGFARSLRLDEEGGLHIVDQYNAANSDDRIGGPLLLDMDGDEEKELLFYHEAEESIQLLKRDSTGVYRYDRSIEIGEIDLVSSRIVRTGDDSHLFFLGTDRFWVVPIGSGGWEVETVSTYETDLKDVRYTRLEVADLNADGVREMIAIDATGHVIEILREVSERQWESALHFTIFDPTQHYQGRRGSNREPREVVIADLTGDSRDDMALLIHDRVLLYYQD